MLPMRERTVCKKGPRNETTPRTLLDLPKDEECPRAPEGLRCYNTPTPYPAGPAEPVSSGLSAVFRRVVASGLRAVFHAARMRRKITSSCINFGKKGCRGGAAFEEGWAFEEPGEGGWAFGARWEWVVTRLRARDPLWKEGEGKWAFEGPRVKERGWACDGPRVKGKGDGGQAQPTQARRVYARCMHLPSLFPILGDEGEGQQGRDARERGKGAG
jgi:hypothetical protein